MSLWYLTMRVLMVFICIHDNLMILRVVWVWAREKKNLGFTPGMSWHPRPQQAAKWMRACSLNTAPKRTNSPYMFEPKKWGKNPCHMDCESSLSYLSWTSQFCSPKLTVQPRSQSLYLLVTLSKRNSPNKFWLIWFVFRTGKVVLSHLGSLFQMNGFMENFNQVVHL